MQDLSIARADEHLRSRKSSGSFPQTPGRRAVTKLWKLCDALITASTRPRARRPWAQARRMLRRRASRYDRAAAAFNLLASLLPGVARAWMKLALRTEKLPLRRSAVTPISFGTGDTVFALDAAPNPSVVIKVERRSLGRPAAEILAMARWRRDAFRRILRDYADVREVFPDVQFLVAHSPLFGVPGVCCLQTFVQGPMRDLLRDVEVDEIRPIVSRRPRLRAQIEAFLTRTIEAWESGEWIVDLGAGNLVLTGEGAATKLTYLDVEMKEIANLVEFGKAPMYAALMERMRSILIAIAPRTRSRRPARTAPQSARAGLTAPRR